MLHMWSVSLCCFVFLLTIMSAAKNLCDEVKNCLFNGREACDRTSQKCPPCIYSLGKQYYTCWDKINATCPFARVKYDCSVLTLPSHLPVDAAVSPVPNEIPPAVKTESVGTSGGSNHVVIIVVAVVGVVLVFVVFVAIRRHRFSKNNDNFDYPIQNDKKDELTPAPSYLHVEKAPRKRSRHEAHGRESKISELARLTARSVVNNDRSFAPSNLSSARDLSARRSTSVNILEEYLKAKKEIDYGIDVMSDVMSDPSDTRSTYMSLPSPMDRSNNRAISVNDSEYDQDCSRSYSESDSEMSYNDERYSISNKDRQKRHNREVEI